MIARHSIPVAAFKTIWAWKRRLYRYFLLCLSAAWLCAISWSSPAWIIWRPTARQYRRPLRAKLMKQRRVKWWTMPMTPPVLQQKRICLRILLIRLWYFFQVLWCLCAGKEIWVFHDHLENQGFGSHHTSLIVSAILMGIIIGAPLILFYLVCSAVNSPALCSAFRIRHTSVYAGLFLISLYLSPIKFF